MKRAVARALVLVNWRGVFYERYELDRHVTALEGGNGAGKTTVMVAAYVVLLPDMTRLRFTNLGETGATGGDKGIWGRLGEAGRPSYAGIDFELPDGERVVAVVHLERKGEPTVEPTPLVITGLGPDVSLQELMLLQQGDEHAVPELGEFRDQVARLGGQIPRCNSAKDYFRLLFKLGVTPMELSTDDQRNKLNEMLRTSMTGGMSRGLLTGLRSFLLRKEDKLAHTLRTMKKNLAACRRLRAEAHEAQALEHELSQTYQAGAELFSTALVATRERAAEMSRNLERARTRAANAADHAERARLQLKQTEASLEQAVSALDAARADAEHAKRWERAVDQALQLRDEQDRLQAEVHLANDDASVARDALEAAQAELTRRSAELDRSERQHRDAADGVKDHQKGLDTLHRQAAAHSQVVSKLDRAQAGLEQPVDPAELTGSIATARHRLTEADRQRRALKTRIDDADAHRERHARAAAALKRIHPQAEANHDAAVAALDTVHQWRRLAERRGQLQQDLARSEQLAARQAGAGTLAKELGVEGAEGVAASLASAQAELDATAKARTKLAQRQAEHRAAMQRNRESVEALRLRSQKWIPLNGIARALAESSGLALTNRDELDLLRAQLSKAAQSQRDHIESLTTEREARIAQANELLASGGSFPPELLRVRDELQAELLASFFDDVSLEDAPVLEARLGPLAHALVVDDLDAATQRARSRPSSLPTLWLMDRDTGLKEDPSQTHGTGAKRDVVMDEGPARRVTRIPANPTLGSRAREQRAETLRAQARALQPALMVAKEALRSTEERAAQADVLLEGTATWLQGGPAEELQREADRGQALLAQLDGLEDQQARLHDATQRLTRRIEDLTQLHADAWLLDEQDYAAAAAALSTELEVAARATVSLRDAGDAPATLAATLDALKRRPWSPDQVKQAQAEWTEKTRLRERLDEAVECLVYVQDNQHALAWTRAAERLAAETALRPMLTAQLDSALAAVKGAREREGAARRLERTEAERYNKADARLQGLQTRLQAVGDALTVTGVQNPTPEGLQQAKAAHLEANARIDALDTTKGKLQRLVGRQGQEHEDAQKELAEAEHRLDAENKQARPAIEAWNTLRTEAAQHGMETAEPDSPQTGLAAVGIWERVGVSAAQLTARLEAAKGSAEVLRQVRGLLSSSDHTRGVGALRAWLAVREWICTRLPAQMARVNDPRRAMARFRDALIELQQRLARQEEDLRGASENVARSIETDIRKANTRRSRLNRHLEGIRFGNIDGIRVRMRRIKRMTAILDALRTGQAQALLFKQDMALEEALDELFRRHGGKRSGGERLLDYREYIQLDVEVRRTASKEWEEANPTRLSTGEAIGVGAALMMVVLTEWERDATLLRGRRDHGSLRLLFLDEANRLDKVVLGTVFDLCRNLDLQLLVAAPEVDRAEGCTVFRLVRVEDDQGREQVLVSGRRLIEA